MSRCGSTTAAVRGLLVADQIRRVRQAIEIELVQDHASSCAKIRGLWPSIHAGNFSDSAPRSPARSPLGRLPGGRRMRAAARRRSRPRRPPASPISSSSTRASTRATPRSRAPKRSRSSTAASSPSARRATSATSRRARTQVIDAQRMTVVPGFIDAHCHPSGVSELYGVNTNLRTRARDCRRRSRRRPTATPPGFWVTGFMFDDTKLDRAAAPASDLDEATTDHPVVGRTIAAATRTSTTARRSSWPASRQDTPDPDRWPVLPRRTAS